MVSYWSGQQIIVGEMFVMFLSYFAIQIYYFFVYGFGEQDEIGIASLPAPVIGGTGKWNNNDFKRDFSLWFTYHVAAASVSVMYAPYTFEIIVAWVHLAAYLTMLVFIFISCTPNTFRLPWFAMAACNVILMIAGLIGV